MTILFVTMFFGLLICHLFFFFNDTATTEIYTLSLHDALPILRPSSSPSTRAPWPPWRIRPGALVRSEEHTSELQSHSDLVCRLLLEKKKKKKTNRLRKTRINANINCTVTHVIRRV